MGVLRLSLALSVVLAHSGGIFHFTIVNAVTSVQIFYIISGFYMSLVLTEKYDCRRDIIIFYSNRLLRIYSTYYLCLLISIGVCSAIYFKSGAGSFGLIRENWNILSIFDKIYLFLSNFTIFGLEGTLFMGEGPKGLIFNPDGPQITVWPMALVAPAWSISLELAFYLLVPFLIRLKSRWLIGVVGASLLARLSTYYFGYNNDPWLYRFFPFELALFVSGMLSYRLYREIGDTLPTVSRRAIAILFLVGVFGNQLLLHVLEHFALSAEFARWPLYALVVVALPCLFAETRQSQRDGALGEFSYPLYLIHWPIVQLYAACRGFDYFGGALGRDPFAGPICAVGSLIGAWLLVRFVERPINLFRQALLRRRLTFSSPLFSRSFLNRGSDANS